MKESKIARYVLPTYARTPIRPVRGEGARLWDDEGSSYLDFCMGIAVCSLGHCHPKLVSAVQAQAAQLMHCSNLYEIQGQGDLAEFIVSSCVELPGKVFFSNSGAESNDGLIKTARRYGHKVPAADGSPRYEVITFNQSFHGRTLGSMAATGQDKIKVGFDPMLPGFKHVPFNDLDAVKAAITKETVAVLLEPVQGEGGVNPCTPEFLRGLAKLCTQKELLLLIDEVQCGFGRCGAMMGWRAVAPEVVPDGISWAKGLGGGFPIGAFWVSDRFIGENADVPLSSLMDPGSHGSTYGGNPLACAASLAVLTELANEDLPQQSRALGHFIRRTIRSWELPCVETARGLGLLIGIVLNPELIAVPEGHTVASFVVAKLKENGLLAVPAGPSAVRLLPPLNVTQEEVDESLAIVKKTLKELA